MEHVDAVGLLRYGRCLSVIMSVRITDYMLTCKS